MKRRFLRPGGFAKNAAGAFLLLELLAASAVLCITGAALVRIYSAELELSALGRDYDLAVRLYRQKRFELERALKTADFSREGPLVPESGDFPAHPRFRWIGSLKPHPERAGLYVLELEIKGLFRGRTVRGVEWIRANPDAREIDEKEPA
jgi:hypothetical protein